jgi:MFS superfamily sulfate permease-like transporter
MSDSSGPAATAAAAWQLHKYFRKWGAAMLGTILVVVLILLLLGAIPKWPYSEDWGYLPSGTVGLVLLIIILLVITGRL